ncbi:hypothetical protein [Maridesulfovibrio ferrireducens]|uniref:hypothetical protein n=1 Tax=Maridesulfovibrio ferrireducens TaxID=246191 RepID=UPI001A1A9243|nr:hypothetical protein [Maridesulfovibrio ferrireducens]MBI9110289.1 hypothetical protein [Maridesulfovibrio ferrireducens]
MDKTDFSIHTDKMQDACCILTTLQELFEKRDQYGEAFIVEHVRDTMLNGLAGLEAVEMSLKPKKTGKSAAILKMVAKN